MWILVCHAVESEIENGNGRANDDSLNINLCEVEPVISKTFSVQKSKVAESLLSKIKTWFFDSKPCLVFLNVLIGKFHINLQFTTNRKWRKQINRIDRNILFFLYESCFSNLVPPTTLSFVFIALILFRINQHIFSSWSSNYPSNSVRTIEYDEHN